MKILVRKALESARRRVGGKKNFLVLLGTLKWNKLIFCVILSEGILDISSRKVV